MDKILKAREKRQMMKKGKDTSESILAPAVREGIRRLISDVRRLMKTPRVSRIVSQRLTSFHEVDRNSPQELHKELCFCIMTAQFSAERAVELQRVLGNAWWCASQEELMRLLKTHGYRFPPRARWMVAAREYTPTIQRMLTDMPSPLIRDWLVNNIDGIGMKEASHFLRNVGVEDVAIIDVHVIRLLTRYRILLPFKSLTHKRYMTIEVLLSQIAQRLGLSLAALDLYLWYLQKGEIVK